MDFAKQETNWSPRLRALNLFLDFVLFFGSNIFLSVTMRFFFPADLSVWILMVLFLFSSKRVRCCPEYLGQDDRMSLGCLSFIG